MTAALYIVLAFLVAVLVAAQVWIARATGRAVHGSNAASYIKAFNIVLLLAALGIALIALARR